MNVIKFGSFIYIYPIPYIYIYGIYIVCITHPYTRVNTITPSVYTNTNMPCVYTL